MAKASKDTYTGGWIDTKEKVKPSIHYNRLENAEGAKRKSTPSYKKRVVNMVAKSMLFGDLDEARFWLAVATAHGVAHRVQRRIDALKNEMANVGGRNEWD